jgi:hypothetical protein
MSTYPLVPSLKLWRGLLLNIGTDESIYTEIHLNNLMKNNIWIRPLDSYFWILRGRRMTYYLIQPRDGLAWSLQADTTPGNGRGGGTWCPKAVSNTQYLSSAAWHRHELSKKAANWHSQLILGTTRCRQYRKWLRIVLCFLAKISVYCLWIRTSVSDHGKLTCHQKWENFDWYVCIVRSR